MDNHNYPYSYEPIYDSRRPDQERKRWDVFEDPPTVVQSGSTVETKLLDAGEKFGKILTYILTFTVILGGAVISKGTFGFMVAQLSTVSRPYCNRDLDRNKQFVVHLPQTERIAWLWLIMFAYFAPQVQTFLRSGRKLLYKSWKRPTFLAFIMVFISESCSSIGVAILVYVVLPRLDSVKALMLTNAVCFIPAVLLFVGNFLKRMRNVDFRNDPNSVPILILDCMSIFAQASAFFIWPFMEENNILFYTIASGILISFGWWENFAPMNGNYQKLIRFDNSRYFTYLFVSLWKCLLFFTCMVVIVWIDEGLEPAGNLFTNFTEAFQEHLINVTEIIPRFEAESNASDYAVRSGYTLLSSNHLAPVWVFLINIISTYMCFVFGKWACKVQIQAFSYSFPINLTIPVSLSILIAMCGVYMNDECTFYNTIPLYMFFNSPSIYNLNHFIGQQQSWIWLLWLLSQVWITAHTWTPKSEKMASSEKLYVRPLYEPFLIDQDLALNRRIDDGADWRDEDDLDEEIIDDTLLDIGNDKAMDFATVQPDDSITRIYACATMWHETTEEMMEFLKSIFRMDEDQHARKTVREQFQFTMPDYYEFETHIFFDDAFVRVSQDDPDPQINEFVKQLVTAVDEAATKVHGVAIRLRPPKRYITPYGGRLVWTLPGKTKMIAHLKDKKKIRAKKRWSQVMYMYYLLGHRLMERTDISSTRKDVIGENTFILALDGDIDFQPKAVLLLVELMKKNKSLGAACGRIHPIGSGPLAWYQMFEYAVGHWMQKATEHIIGCVLCSPGCFSLFRGKALMDDSVMRKYTTKSSEARHYVQYDQGEDRWLCTLLLQRGYRVEYAAASDAYTHCPEGFNEFYNQRRRWMPSTTANILDLLMNSDSTIKANDNISKTYIWYQGLLMAGTILGPGTIFLMLIGAFVAVFQWSQWTSFLYNFFPLLTFIIVCALFSKDNIQLFVASILSGVYALVMMAVFVGVVLQISEDGWLAPSTLFFFCLAGVYIIAAIIHPKEFYCLKHALVYYVTIPSMYMLLAIYSAFNMNNVSWGTREVTVVQKPNANNGAPAEEKGKEDKPKNWIINWCGARPEETSGALEFSFAGLFKCICCTNMDQTENRQLEDIKLSLHKIQQKLEALEKDKMDAIDGEEPMTSRRRTTRMTIVNNSMGEFSLANLANSSSSDNQSLLDTSSDIISENTWIDDEVFQRGGEVDFISSDEQLFWNGLLDKYLHPIDDGKDKARIAQDLKNLRDKVVLAFFMLNALFVLVIFLLTLNQDTIHVEWPFGVKANFTYLDDINQIRIEKEYLQLEPIGIVFLVAFATLIIIQFFAMLKHRFQTFSQIMANTNVNLSLFKTNTQNLTQEELLEQNAVDLAKQLQKLKGANDDRENVPEAQPHRRKTIHKLEQRSRNPQEPISDLDVAFQRRYGKIANNDNYQGPIRRETIMLIERRKSKMTRPSGLRLGQTNLGFDDDTTI